MLLTLSSLARVSPNEFARGEGPGGDLDDLPRLACRRFSRLITLRSGVDPTHRRSRFPRDCDCFGGGEVTDSDVSLGLPSSGAISAVLDSACRADGRGMDLDCVPLVSAAMYTPKTYPCPAIVPRHDNARLDQLSW